LQPVSSFAKSTFTITVITVAGLGLGFVSSLLIAARFGVGAAMDAYLAATTVPALVILILSTALGATVVPLLAEYRARDPEEAWRLVGALILAVGGTCLLLSVAGMLYAVPITRTLTPGLGEAGTQQSATLLQWLLPSIVLAALNTILSSVHYCRKKFLAPLLIRLMFPLFTIGGVALFAQTTGVKILVLAALAAQALHVVVLVAGLVRDPGVRHVLSPDWRHPGFHRFFRLTGPLMLAMCFYKLRPVYERWVASGMEPGSISLLGYASRLTQALQPALVSGIAISGFALMAGLVAKGDTQGLRTTLIRSCNALFFASVPLAVLLFGFAEPIMGFVFERGLFERQNTLATAPLFALYALALPAGAVGTVVGQTFYALQNTRIPIIAGLIDIILFVALGSFLAPRWGLIALPVSFVTALYATSLMVSHLLGRVAGFPVLPLLGRPFVRSLAAALAALGLGLILQYAFASSYRDSILCLVAAGLAYGWIQHAVFRSPETARALGMLANAVRRLGVGK
jgi:putative peptidoglycan lipid II flippase